MNMFGLAIMELTDIRSSDFGSYTCTATNASGTATASFDIIEDTNENKKKKHVVLLQEQTIVQLQIWQQ